MSDFPNQVNGMQAPAVEGDFASANPRATVLAGEGALVCGNGVDDGVNAPSVFTNGIIVGRFGWLSYAGIDNDEAPAVVNTFGAGLPAGLVHRIQVGLITTYLASATMVLGPRGSQTTLFNNVDMWVKNRGGIYAQVGMKAFARFSDGAVVPALTGATPGGGSGSASSIAAGAFGATGSITNNILTVTGGVTGANGIRAGGILSGGTVASGTKIVAQVLPLLPGEALNGIGRYTVSIPEQTVASASLTGAYGILTVGGTVVAGFGQGQTITGTNVVVPTTVYEQLSGTAGAGGTYVVDNATVVGSTAITSANSIETPWIIKSGAAVGALMKISRVS